VTSLHSALGSGAEFDIIRNMLRGRLRADPRVRVGPGDDAAVLDDGTVLSVDMVLEGVHFLRGWLTHEEIGYRAATAALSDLAAMAAEPIGLLVSMALTDADRAHAEELLRGADAAAVAVGAIIIGGDLTHSPDRLVLDCTAVGRADRPVLRNGARPGHRLWVTGRLGGAASAVRSWLRGEEAASSTRAAFVRPAARVAEARWIARHGEPSAMLDLSDGLVGDASHIAAASGVRVVIDEASVPVAAGATLEDALDGGDDYELLFTAPAGHVEALSTDFEAAFDVALTRIGEVETGKGVRLRTRDGRILDRDVGGYRHFGSRS
jgi:thiamine-monophosphate kinase